MIVGNDLFDAIYGFSEYPISSVDMFEDDLIWYFGEAY